ncbi:MAG: DnaD domain protein [Oscillospiraceae bacterium]|nr:DnaD domain protein [Oscillospiraceae bacterium]
METIIPSADAVYINAEAAEKLLSSGSGDAALLYISILKNHGALDRAEAEKLPLSGGVDAALDKLRELGLVKGRPAREREQPPRVSVDEIYDSAKSGSGFAELVPELESILGKPLSPAELQTFFCAFDYLRLPPEVILVLTRHCVEDAARRLGRGRLPSARSIEREAFRWADDEVFTLEAAEERLRRAEAVRTGVGRLAAALRLGDRKLGKSEENYLAAWAEMGFEPETVLEAYDKTVLKKGSLNWPYMNSILRSWHEKGIRTPEDVEKLDSRRPADGAGDDADMKKLLKKLAGGGEERR